MQDILSRLASGVRGRLPGAAAVPPGPRLSDDFARRARDQWHPSGLTVGDGSRRADLDQILDPHIHPDNVRIVEPGYDPYGGLSRSEFQDQFLSRTNDRGMPDWEWPPANGAVPGTASVERVRPGQEIVLDRVGGPFGAYFADPETAFGARALPPDRLNFDRNLFRVDTTHHDIVSGRVRLETSEIAPWFGQPGGGQQYRLVEAAVDESGVATLKPLSQQVLVERGILPDLRTEEVLTVNDVVEPGPELGDVFREAISRGYINGLDFYVEGFDTAFSSELVILERAPERGYRVVYSDMGQETTRATGERVEDVVDEFFHTLSSIAWGRGRGPKPGPRRLDPAEVAPDPRSTTDDAIWAQFS